MTKLWQDKTDEEFKKDIETMVKNGVLTIYNPEEYIGKLTMEEAKEYLNAIYEEWDKESQAANDSIVEILESYFEFMEIFERTIKAQRITPPIKVMALELVKKRRAQWEPILQKAKEVQNKKRNNNERY